MDEVMFNKYRPFLYSSLCDVYVLIITLLLYSRALIYKTTANTNYVDAVVMEIKHGAAQRVQQMCEMTESSTYQHGR